MSQSTISQSCRDGATASWVINQYFRGVKCLAQGHNTAAVGFEPPTSRSGVRHSTTEPPRSPPNSCLVKIGKQRYRTFVDTGAECSLMHRRIYDQLKNKPRLINKKVCLQSANGTELKCNGCITVQICIGGTEMSQDFYVIRDLNRNLILGLDWLKQNNVRIYFDLKCLRINGKHYVNLEEDIHIASTVRMKKTCLIKPQTAMICYGKVRENPDLPVGQSYEITQIDMGFLVNQPGLQIIVLTLAKDRSLPLLIVNNTNKFIKIYRHGLLAKISGIQNNVASVNSVIQKKSVKLN